MTAAEIVGEIYKVHFPNKSYETGRNARRHVLHERLARAGARFVQSAGWEIAGWYAAPEHPAQAERWGWGRQPSFRHVAEEHRACREDVILMDMSFMSKFLVQGRDAHAFLGRLSCNDLDVAPGRIVYTQWVNDRGGIEADLTVTRRAESEFLLGCSDTAHRHVETWMRRHLPAGARVDQRRDHPGGKKMIGRGGKFGFGALPGMAGLVLAAEVSFAHGGRHGGDGAGPEGSYYSGRALDRLGVTGEQKAQIREVLGK